MQDSDVPPKFQIPWANAAGGSLIRAIPQPSQIGVTNGAASLTDGFPPNCALPIASGGSWPFVQDFNGILKQITQWSRWHQAGGAIPYDSTFQAAVGGYPAWCIVMSASNPGALWMSTVENNTTNPDTGGAGWITVTPMLRGLIVYGASTTFVVPAGVTRVNAGVLAGGSGASGCTVSQGGGGGGGGEYREGWFNVTPGTSITITVGPGGAGGPAGFGSGSPGGASSFGSFCTALPGTAGANASGSSGGGVGGVGGSGGSLSVPGSSGGDGFYSPTQYPGYGGAGGFLGSSVRAGSFTTASFGNANAPGSGGSGSYYNGAAVGGGAGHAGLVTVRY